MPVQNTNAILANNTSEELDQYILVRTGVFHYLQFIDDESQLFNANGPVESKPNMVFYQQNAETRVMLDYSGASDKDKTYLQILFSNLNQFSGLCFSNASYLDDRYNIDTSFNLDLQFREYKDNMLLAKTTNSINSNDLQKVFEGSYFISVPTVSSSGSWTDKTAKTNSLLVSVNPQASSNFSLNYFQNGDLIEIINPNSANNNKRYEILEFTKINNKEVLKLKTKATNESLLGYSTIINVYAKTKKKERTTTTLDKTIRGCCYSYNDKKYLVNATEYECDVRTNGQYEFFKGTCQDFSEYQTPLPTITVNSKIVETRKLQYVLFEDTSVETLNISFEDNKIKINNEEYTNYAFARGKIYKLVQDDESNLGLPIRFTRNYSTIRQELDYYYDNVSGTTNPEGIGSEIYIKITQDTIDTFFLFTENNLNIQPVSIVVI